MSSTILFTSPPPIPTRKRPSPAPPPSLSPSPAPADKLALLIDKAKSTKQLREIHAIILRLNFQQHPILTFKLQRSYSSHGRLDYSVSLFSQTQNPNVFMWTSIIYTHAFHGLHQEALTFYAEMLNHDVQPNAFTFSSILKSCPLQFGKILHSHAVKYGFDSDSYVRTTLLDVYARGGDLISACLLFDSMPEKNLVSLTAMITCYTKQGKIDDARILFDQMDERDVVCWNVMIDGYTQHGKPNEALVLFRQMLAAKVKPNEVTVLSVLSACGQLGALESGRWLHSYIENNGVPVNLHVGTALIDMYSKCGSLGDAHLVFDKIKDKDIVAWNSMLVGYSVNGFGREAINLFYDMCSLGFRPTDITFIGILSACGYAGLINEGREFFNSMQDRYGIEPKIEHYGCMVNLLGRAGHLKEAYELVKNMQTVKPDSVLWGTLLGACRLHGDNALGEEIAAFIVSQNLENSGTYILLSNIYAAEGNWDGVTKVRTLMKDSGVLKEPGCSSIEINSKVHEFLAGDLKHPKRKEIYMMLSEINGWLKACNYTPQTEIVLHDIGEREKERLLEVHSEKLAIAFGLISTQPKTTIKIVKNLRVCLDCHEVTKVISKVTGRKIVVRDRNRFHHFVNGTCSCGDYW